MTAFTPMTRGTLTATLAAGAADMAAALDLRHLTFRTLRGLGGEEGDAFDPVSDHLLIRDGDKTLATFRTRQITRATASYTAQFYDLGRLPATPMLELGRFCLHPDAPDPDTLRLALAALTRLVDLTGASHLIGCTSLYGTDLALYAAALAPHHASLSAETPVLAGEILPLAPLRPRGPQRPLPPILRHYLSLGGTLSGHAVVDRALQTCHVLTLLKVADIPPSRARTLRELARDPDGQTLRSG